jgi:hypothetical protein
MATRDTLVFSGRRWPAARPVSEELPQGLRPLEETLDRLRPPESDFERLGPRLRQLSDELRQPSAFAQLKQTLDELLLPRAWDFEFVASGQGQAWSSDRSLGFWRSYASLHWRDRAIGQPALRFIQRHGDPFGNLDRGETSSIAPWFPLMIGLDWISKAWDPPGPDGISRLSADRDRHKFAEHALRELAPPDEKGLPEIELIAQGRGLVPRATSLAAFMAASAASALQRGVAMRQCRYSACTDWFELGRADAVYCSGSCQAADSKQRAIQAIQKPPAPEAVQETTDFKQPKHSKKGHPHGERAQANPPRPNRLSRGVARERPRRKGATPK